MRPLGTASIALALACSASSQDTPLTLAPLFQDHMVLQRELPIRVWGTVAPGVPLEIRVANHAVNATAGPEGRFAVTLPPLDAGGPHVLEVSSGPQKVTLEDVLVGEVWLCSGQSNMEWTMRKFADTKDALAASGDDQLRLFTVQRATSLEEKTTCAGSWAASSPEVAKEFSAVAYFFGRELRGKLDVPVGLVASSWGGTRAEAWTRRAAMRQKLELDPILTAWNEIAEGYPAAKQKYDAAIVAWTEASAKAEQSGGPKPRKPRAPLAPTNRHAPSVLFNGMIAPLVPFRFRGVIWYQGESNAGRAAQYATLFPTMIRDWRRAFGQGDFPFLFVQLANWGRGKHWAELREAQRDTLREPNTGMAVTIDLGDAQNIHPPNKAEVGRRLSLHARRIVYGERDLVAAGPLYRHMQIESGRARLHFANVGGGLVAKGEQLTGFAIAGADRKFVAATAEIDGATVVVSSKDVSNPVAVRYAWAQDPQCNLYNDAELPASPFRTDDWVRATEGKLKPF